MSLEQLNHQALEINEKYKKLNHKRGQKQWGILDYAMGLSGDIGDLNKTLMALHNLRNGGTEEELRSELSHELADCLWSILLISNLANIDLEQTYIESMAKLNQKLDSSLEE